MGLAASTIRPPRIPLKTVKRIKCFASTRAFFSLFSPRVLPIKIVPALAIPKQRIVPKLRTTVTKEYVKNRKNIYTNPAINAYNRTTDSANKTVTTLLKILNGSGAGKKKEEKDPLLELINGGDTLE